MTRQHWKTITSDKESDKDLDQKRSFVDQKVYNYQKDCPKLIEKSKSTCKKSRTNLLSRQNSDQKKLNTDYLSQKSRALQFVDSAMAAYRNEKAASLMKNLNMINNLFKRFLTTWMSKLKSRTAIDLGETRPKAQKRKIADYWNQRETKTNHSDRSSKRNWQRSCDEGCTPIERRQLVRGTNLHQ